MERTQATQKIVFFRSRNIVGKMSEFKFRWKTERERERRSKVCQFIEWFHGIKNRKNNKKILHARMSSKRSTRQMLTIMTSNYYLMFNGRTKTTDEDKTNEIRPKLSNRNGSFFFSSVVIVHSSRFFNLH